MSEKLKQLIANNTLSVRQAKTIEELAEIEETFFKSIESLFSLQGVGCSLPTKEAMFLQEVMELKKLQKIDPNMNRIDFGAGFVRCYKWLIALK
tara:strand:- start:516 stop:797 length:282 start_codon:yes stop_codon:yes gene_type:complete